MNLATVGAIIHLDAGPIIVAFMPMDGINPTLCSFDRRIAHFSLTYDKLARHSLRRGQWRMMPSATRLAVYHVS